MGTSGFATMPNGGLHGRQAADAPTAPDASTVGHPAHQGQEGAGLAMLGGSFNPPHIGHLRMAIEVREAFAELVHGVDLIPCFTPPHKDVSRLLPFAMRTAMLEGCLEGIPHLRCNRLESLRNGPSYTWDTLQDYVLKAPTQQRYFILGSADYVLLPTWFRGLELPALCHIIVIPRGDFSLADFVSATLAMWPQAAVAQPAIDGTQRMILPSGNCVHCFGIPRFDVSSSYVRSLWLAGRDIAGLVPEPVKKFLTLNSAAVRECWSRVGRPSSMHAME
jgi:nicotinate-nucleotide adenylyltransferase